ncbi:MAG: hypothetical protein R2748_10170 [Bryobacterales bacterium]
MPLHVGVADEQTIDTIRVTWANGMIQNEIAQPTSGPLVRGEAAAVRFLSDDLHLERP